MRSVVAQDISNLRESLNSIDEKEFGKAVNSILTARKIYIMGIRASAPLSEFMHFYMTLLFDDVVLVRSTCTNELFEQIMPIGKGDVMIGISFPRYSARTINSMGYAKDKGATIIAITDKDDTAMTEYADIKLFAKSSMASFVDSLTARYQAFCEVFNGIFRRFAYGAALSDQCIARIIGHAQERTYPVIPGIT